MPDSDIRVLFRFRDLIASTLNEHRQIIDQHGSCWWGWWKRPHEEPHKAVWDELSRSASPSAPVEIGLFNSGSGEVYLARVIGVILPKESGERVAVPEDEEDLVPDYYRKSPFSRAWLRLSFISPEPMRFFGSFSYDSIPQISNYSEVVLQSFAGKVIVDVQELRGMDTTIWKVRPSNSGDPSHKVLLTVPTIGKPISREPVEAQSNLVVHISDPHFAVGPNRHVHVWRLESEHGGSGRPTLAEAISDAVGNRTVGLVVVTGDFTFTGLAEEYDEAHRFLVRLAGLWNLDIDRFIVIPGNHDIQWTRKDTYDGTSDVDFAPLEAQENYRAFYRKLFGHELTPVLAMGRRYVLPYGLVLEICGVNSSSLEQGRNFLAGMGRVQENSFREVARELGWQQASCSLRVLALHHHLVLTDNLEEASAYYRGFGIAVDAPRIQRMAAEHGVHLALHGHKHRVFVWRSGVYQLPEHAQSSWRLGDLSIVGGGSAGSRETEAHKNYFNIMEIEGKGLSLEIFRAENAGAFGRMQRWWAGLALEGGRLALGDWELAPAMS